jgi:hypothetical protein
MCQSLLTNKIPTSIIPAIFLGGQHHPLQAAIFSQLSWSVPYQNVVYSLGNPSVGLPSFVFLSPDEITKLSTGGDYHAGFEFT